MVWDKNKPAGSQKFRLADDDIRANNVALEAALDEDHDFTTGGTQTGEHHKVTMPKQSSDPSATADKGKLYTKEFNSLVELYYRDAAGTICRLTTNGIAGTPDMIVSATEPTETHAGLYWVDTTDHMLKIRNEADSGWITLFYLSTTVVPALSVDETAIKSNAVTASKIKDRSVTWAKLSHYEPSTSVPKFLVANADTERSVQGSTYVKKKEFKCDRPGNFIICFDLKSSQAGSVAKGQLKRNGVEVGTERTTTSTDYTTYTETIWFTSSGESIGTGDGSKTTFTGYLTYPAVKRTGLSITDGFETFTDNGEGILTGNQGGSGTIDYISGYFSVTFNTAPDNLDDITATYDYCPWTPDDTVELWIRGFSTQSGICQNFRMYADQGIRCKLD